MESLSTIETKGWPGISLKPCVGDSHSSPSASSKKKRRRLFTRTVCKDHKKRRRRSSRPKKTYIWSKRLAMRRKKYSKTPECVRYVRNVEHRTFYFTSCSVPKLPCISSTMGVLCTPMAELRNRKYISGYKINHLQGPPETLFLKVDESSWDDYLHFSTPQMFPDIPVYCEKCDWMDHYFTADDFIKPYCSRCERSYTLEKIAYSNLPYNMRSFTLDGTAPPWLELDAVNTMYSIIREDPMDFMHNTRFIRDAMECQSGLGFGKPQWLSHVNTPFRNFLPYTHMSWKKHHVPQMSVVDSFFSNSAVNLMENLVLYITAISESSSLTQMSAITALFLKTYMKDESLIKKVSDSVIECIAPFEKQAGLMSAPPAWLQALREAKTNYTLAKSSPVATAVCNVLTTLVSLGVCQASNFEFSIQGVKLFTPIAAKAQRNSTDLFGAIADTVMAFAEGGWRCYTEGSVAPLVFGNSDIVDLFTAVDDLVLYTEVHENGNLGEVLDTLIDNDRMESMLTTTMSAMERMINTTESSFLRKIFLDKLATLKRAKARFDQTALRGGMRVRPFSIAFYGPTAVAKSSLAAYTAPILLRANGFDYTDQFIFTVTEGEQFLSGYASFITCMIFDDINNILPKYNTENPKLINEAVGNARARAIMPNVESKGVVRMEPKIVITTKNRKDNFAHVKCVEPASMMRRDDIIVTVEIKPQYASDGMLDSTKAVNAPKFRGLPDLWVLNVEKVRVTRNPNPGQFSFGDKAEYVPVIHKGKSMTGVSYAEFLECMLDLTAIHFANQKKLVEDNKEIGSKIVFCDSCNRPEGFCSCVLDDDISEFTYPDCNEKELEKQSGALSILGQLLIPRGKYSNTRVEGIFNWMFGRSVSFVTRQFNHLFADLDFCASQFLYAHVKWLESSLFARWCNWLPDEAFENPHVQKFIAYHNRSRISKWAFPMTVVWGIGAVYLKRMIELPLSFSACVMMCFGAFEYKNQERKIMDRIRKERALLEPALQEYSAEMKDSFAKVCAVGATIVASVIAWKKARELMNPLHKQGNIIPSSVKDIEVRDAEKTQVLEAQERNWSGFSTLKKTLLSPFSQTSTHDQIVNKLQKNLYFMTFDVVDNAGVTRQCGCDAFFPESGVGIVPAHVFQKIHGGSPEFVATFSRGVRGTRFKAQLSVTYSSKIDGSDLALVWLPQKSSVDGFPGGTKASLMKFFPKEDYKGGLATLVYRTKDGECTQTQVSTQVDYPNQGLLMPRELCLVYNYEPGTFVGLCMAVLVSAGRGGSIVGFHTAGMTGDKLSAGSLININSYMKAREKLKSTPGVLLPVPESPILEKQLGVNIFESRTLHPKSPLNNVDGHCEFYGSVIGRSTFYSQVHKTIISDTVSRVFEEPCVWGPPLAKEIDPWSKDLPHYMNPSPGIPGSLLKRACESYGRDLREMFSRVPDVAQELRPLTIEESLNGIDGKRFVDAIKLSTAVGFPLTGSKRNHVRDGLLSTMFINEVERLRSLYKQGFRANPVFKTFIKDEATERKPTLEEEKARLVQAAPFAFQVLVRQYFLPLCRILSLFPTLSECAVGVNVHGPEWSQLEEFMNSMSEVDLLGWDYSKYDKRFSSSLTMALFSVWIDICREYGYSEEDLEIMRGIATDIAHPLIAYNGDLVCFHGTNPSGQNLTVFVNSGGNSILVRAGFYSLFPHKNFRDHVSIMTYGDDLKGSVSKECRAFNNVYFAKWLLSNCDMVITPPNKNEVMTEFLEKDKADFLKHLGVYHPKLGMNIGALAQKSILKSLHCVVRSELSEVEQACANIDGAAREWFAHGETIYEHRRTQLRMVAEAHNLLGWCPELGRSYDDQVSKWKSRYLTQSEVPV